VRLTATAALALIAAGFASSSAGAALSYPQVQRATELCRSGERALEVGNFGRARRSFLKVIEIVPVYPEAHLGMGHLAMRERRFEDALREYETARDRYVDMSRALFDLDARRFAEARAEITELMDDLVARQRFAPVPLKMSRLESAIERLKAIEPPDRSALADPPGQIHFYVGNALFRLNRLDEAVAAWETCLRTAPAFPAAYNNLAVGYWLLGRLEDARRTLALAAARGLPINKDLAADLERSAALGAAPRG